MHWKKLGLIYTPASVHTKLVSHAANPLAVFLDGDVFRVFFSGRDAQSRSSVGYVDVDITKREVIYVHDRPVFEHGPEGSFYSHGVSVGNCYKVQDSRYILFMGWQYPASGHWRGEVGRLVLECDHSLRIDSEVPFMAVDAIDKVSLSYPWVMQNMDGSYQMWYGSTLTWDAENGEMIHVINHATSTDGDSWNRMGLAVPYQLGVAQAFSRPSVIKDPDGYHMWFSYRSGNGQKYRVGYASSNTGESWELKLDQVGIDVSAEGWDSEMIEYPFVFDHKSERYMLYNGNGYGKTGFGLAILES